MDKGQQRGGNLSNSCLMLRYLTYCHSARALRSRLLPAMTIDRQRQSCGRHYAHCSRDARAFCSKLRVEAILTHTSPSNAMPFLAALVMTFAMCMTTSADAATVLFRNHCTRPVSVYDNNQLVCQLDANTGIDDPFPCNRTITENALFRASNSSEGTGEDSNVAIVSIRLTINVSFAE